jgi:mycothiol synthase
VSLPQAITRRPLTHDDLDVVTALIVDDEAALFDRPSRLTSLDVRSWWARTDLAENSWLFEESGRAVALGWLDRHDDLGIYVGIVAQGAKNRGLGGALVDVGEARAVATGAERIHTFSLGPDRAAAELFLSRGYREVRRFYDMAIELDGPVDEPALPDGLVLEIFVEADARPFHAALGEAFEDHWENHPLPFEQWWQEKLDAPDYDPTLWFLIRDGGEIAATIRNDAERNGGGYVGAIGVRRPWRGRGLARALLARTFNEFYERGQSRVTLGVDAQNPTGATQLYESIGMHAESEAIVFEKASA